MSIRHHLRIILRATFVPLLLLASPSLPLSAQAPVDYDDVAVIINEASEVSKEIGAYFAEKRNIPETNLIRINVPDKETINDQEFRDLRSQVEARLNENDLGNTIRYMVTTKGVPLRINRSTENETPQMTPKASVDNELTLVRGQFESLIGADGWAMHNYAEIVTHFNRSFFPIYLVTRLDAYTKEDVFAMIDNGGPNRLVNKDSVLFVLDQDPQPIDSAFHQSQSVAAQILRQRGWRVLLNSDSTYVTDQKNVLGYASWGSNDHYDHHYTENAIPRNTWSPGALAETFVSTSARSLQPGTTYGQSLIADWLAEGVAGAKGYVFEPFTAALAFPHILFDRYTDESQDTAFNLAESFYMASRTLSWMDVMLGDPKTSIITEIPDIPAPRLFPTIAACVGDQLTLRPGNQSRGTHDWFLGDSAAVMAGGFPPDRNHSLWVGSGRALTVTTDEPGTQTYTYVTRNISGYGLAQVTVTILPPPVPDFSPSADTVGLNEPVTFTDLTEGEGSRRWTFGDGGVVNDDEGKDQTHSYREPGVYPVTLTVINDGCFRSVTKFVVVRSTTGVNDRNRAPALGIQLLPNPASDKTVIVMEMENPAEVTVRIYDPNGRLLQEEKRYSPPSFRHTLSLDGYPAGAYMIEVQAGERHGSATLVRQ